MADSSESSPVSSADRSSTRALDHERIVFLGKLASMSRKEACILVQQLGAELVPVDSEAATLVVIGDNCISIEQALDGDSAEVHGLRQRIANGKVRVVRESELWQRVGLVAESGGTDRGVRQLYTPAMLAELLDVPVAAVRRWNRQGALVACRSVRRLLYFDFAEVSVARHLASLLKAGCSLHVIDRKLAELDRSMPQVERPLLDPSIVVSGRCLYRRRGDDLAEPGGQLLIDFDKPSEADEQGAVVISMEESQARSMTDEESIRDETLSALEALQQEAIEWEDQGELDRAAEAYRTMLVAGGPTADVNFALADLLYRMELDEEYVEARANLGCLLAEIGELELAVAAFEGALAFHPDFADAHYHLANALDRLRRPQEAELHWHTFLALAPENPWAETARARLAAKGNVSVSSTE